MPDSKPISAPYTQAHTLHNAMLVWGDPEVVAELRVHEARGDLSPLASIFRKETVLDRQQHPYTRVTDLLRRALIEKLEAGDLVAIGFVEGSPPETAPVAIFSARWSELTPNFEESSATDSRMVIRGIRVTEPPVAMSAPDDLATVPSGPVLVVHRPSLAITFGGPKLVLPARPFGLMELLAEAATSDRRVVHQKEIEQRLWSKTAIPRNGCADTARDLRKRIASVLPNGVTAIALISSRPPGGYILELPPSRVRLET